MKLKLKISLLTLCASLLIQFTFIACEKDDAKENIMKVFVDAASNSTYDLADQTQLNQLATGFAREKSEINIIQDAAVVDLTDSKGAFKAIRVQYEVEGKTVKMVVPIVQMTDSQINEMAGRTIKGQTYFMVDTEACEMKCTTVSPCNTCQQEIIERCKSQTCTCVSGNTGCNPSIIFND